MSRFLLAVWPYAGHLHPNLALANALRARGHEVTFYTGAAAHRLVEQAGFVCFPFQAVAHRLAEIVGLPEADRQYAGGYAPLYQGLTERYSAAFDQGAFRRNQKLKAMYHEWILGTVPEQVADLEAILTSWKPDVLVTDPFMWGPILVLHELQPIVVAVFSYFAACLLPGSDVPPFALGLPKPHDRWTRLRAQLLERAKDLFLADIRRGADRLRQTYHLHPLSMSIMEFSGRVPLYLVASIPEFDYERRDLPPSVHYVGPCLWDKVLDEPTPDWVSQATGDRPIVYVTEGTAQVRAPRLLQAATQGLGALPVQVIMTTGRHRDPTNLSLGPLAPNIRIARWVSHSDLFPRASVVVTHGGSGTVLAALYAGLPLVVAPMQWDQMENALRVVEGGAGLRLMLQHCTPERLRAAVERVLSEPSFRRNAQRLAAASKRYGGAEQAAELLEKLTERSQKTSRPV